MSRRVLFEKGKQREFIDLVIKNASSPSLRGLLQFGIGLNYSTLKNYYIEERTLPENLFLELCSLSKISPSQFNLNYLDEKWGQKKGGKKSKRKK